MQRDRCDVYQSVSESRMMWMIVRSTKRKRLKCSADVLHGLFAATASTVMSLTCTRLYCPLPLPHSFVGPCCRSVGQAGGYRSAWIRHDLAQMAPQWLAGSHIQVCCRSGCVSRGQKCMTKITTLTPTQRTNTYFLHLILRACRGARDSENVATRCLKKKTPTMHYAESCIWFKKAR